MASGAKSEAKAADPRGKIVEAVDANSRRDC